MTEAKDTTKKFSEPVIDLLIKGKPVAFLRRHGDGSFSWQSLDKFSVKGKTGERQATARFMGFADSPQALGHAIRFFARRMAELKESEIAVQPHDPSLTPVRRVGEASPETAQSVEFAANLLASLEKPKGGQKSQAKNSKSA